MRRRRGFTIIELMMVIAIIAVLLSIVTTAAAGAIREARVHKADSIVALVQSGIATYYAQKDRWPGGVGDRIASGSLGTRSNEEGYNGNSNTEVYVLTANEVREVVRELVNESRRGNPMMDISGLFVSRDSGEEGRRGHGLDFMDAVRGTKESKKRMTVNEMNFGYPEPSHGYFRRLKISYSIPTDDMRVSK